MHLGWYLARGLEIPGIFLAAAAASGQRDGTALRTQEEVADDER